MLREPRHAGGNRDRRPEVDGLDQADRLGVLGIEGGQQLGQRLVLAHDELVLVAGFLGFHRPLVAFAELRCRGDAFHPTPLAVGDVLDQPAE